MKNIKIRFILPIFLIFSPLFYIHSETNNPEIQQFNWSLAYGSPGNSIHFINKEDTVIHLHAKDNLRFFFQPLSHAYIYLFLVDSKQQLHALFPASTKLFSNTNYYHNSYFFPGISQWMSIDDNKGDENFFLIVSMKRLNKLELLSTKYLSLYQAADPVKSEFKLAKKKLLDEIKKLIIENSILNKATQKPISIAGILRDKEGNLTIQALNIKSTNLYIRKIIVRH